MNRNNIIAILTAFVMGLSTVAFAATTEDITVTFQIPSAAALSVAYAGSCSTSDFAFIETDTTKDGNMTGINVTQTDETACQAEATPAINVTNTGNIVSNVTLHFTANYPPGVTVKASPSSFDSGGYNATCASIEPPPADDCINVTTSARKLCTAVAVNDYCGVWTWADFSNADMGAGIGVAGTNTTTLRITIVG